MQTRSIIYHFTLQSPWSYLGHAALLGIARHHAAAIVWKPTNLAQVFPESGGLPFAKRHPKRRAYRDIELQRWRAKRDVTLELRPAFWPPANTSADLCTVALVDRGENPASFVTAAFAALWADNKDVADDGVLVELLAEAGHDARAVLTHAKTDDIAKRYATNALEALAAGVFGAPTYLLDGEPFWGQDRLTFLDEALASGREPIRA